MNERNGTQASITVMAILGSSMAGVLFFFFIYPLVDVHLSHQELIVLHAIFIGILSGLTTYSFIKAMRYAKNKQYAEALERDIIQRQKAEQALKEKMSELEISNSNLKTTTAQLVQAAKLTTLGEFSAGICHELNQPLNVMRIICDSALREVKKNRYKLENVTQDFPDVVEQIIKASAIVNHMRAFARGTDEDASQQLCDINDIIKDALRFVGAQLGAHQIELVMNLAPELPKIRCAAVRVEQVILNLISNARLTLADHDRSNRKIEISTRIIEGQSTVAIEVRDNGPGVPESIRHKIFDPFFTTRKQGVGTGLGLSIVTKIIDDHKGKIELESNEGEGATFRVLLPIANSAQ